MEMTRTFYDIRLQDSSRPGEARRAAAGMAEQLGLGAERSNAAALVATELATNLLKHAKDGRIFVQETGSNGSRGMQILATDKGPGISDVAAALQDGFSTSGTLGGGFGAMARMSSAFDLYTNADTGTVVLCEFWAAGKNPSLSNGLCIGTVSTPFPGESLNGDGWVVKSSRDALVFAVVDGLGHGIAASEAAREAERVVRLSESTCPANLLEDCHRALMKTRGAAIGIAAVSAEGRQLTFAGTGNVAGSVSTPDGSRGLTSHNGTLGHVMQRVQEFNYPWTEDSLLVIHTDGVSAKWNLSNYPGLRMKHPSIVAAVLHRDFSRAHDDSTVLVARKYAEQ